MRAGSCQPESHDRENSDARGKDPAGYDPVIGVEQLGLEMALGKWFIAESDRDANKCRMPMLERASLSGRGGMICLVLRPAGVILAI